MRRVLITGGAGFVGANLAVGLAARHADWELIAFDNLHRRGSELNLPRLDEAGVAFVKGDVRDADDLIAIESVDALVECSAEPSALSGLDGDTAYVVHTNLMGAYNCLELARRDDAQFVFLSTSRVYPHGPLNSIALDETPTRYEIADAQPLDGVSPAGISERFPLEGARTLYGASKLAAELLVTEYAESLGVPAVVNRCGVIAGPWQMGKVDQGVFSHWLLSHYFGEPLSYIGYGGAGRQVRDLLHVDDLVELLDEQLSDPGRWAGVTANAGGGRECSLSLVETTRICRALTGNEVPIEPDLESRPGDIPVYLSDCGRLFEHTAWRPRRDAERILRDIFDWVAANRDLVGEALGFRA
jgi:CDP-paratose 2-epimerase